MAERWKLTLRRGPKVTVERFASRDAALDALAAALNTTRVDALPATRVFRREIEPAGRVALRAEVAGPQRLLPRVHAGVDVRGDGSFEAFTGRVSRSVVEIDGDETPVQALRRALA
ncbi:MAG: hypothetical protein JWP17_4093 [Solirubrobacterales bacterium]|jgi:hypothetical protein|nr:hypothetical protein [Solirubrobacterales bacterium]